MEFLMLVLAVFLVVTITTALDSKAEQGNPPKPSPVLTSSRPLSYPTVEDIKAIHDAAYKQRFEIAKQTADMVRPTLIRQIRQGKTYFVYADIFKGRHEEKALAATILRQELSDQGLGRTVDIQEPSYGCCDF